jgi:hypothetical protein
MYPQQREITLYDAVTPVAVTSSTDATPIVVTATSHGLVTGDRVLIYGHTTNIAANGIFKVVVITANTYQLKDEFTGASIAGSGGGSGSSGVMVKAPPILLTTGYRNIVFYFGTTGSATVTMKVAGSTGLTPSNQSSPRYDFPNFGATVGPTSPCTFLQSINLDTAAALNGATGWVATGTDLNIQYEVNVNVQKYMTVFPISWTQGAITIKAIMVTNA